jgi:Uncharacterized protein conserved in bacteria
MGLLNPVDTIVSIAGEQIHFVELKLSQHFYEHHRCEILVDFEELDERWMANPVSMINYIGESIDITFTHRISGETTVFSGIVTNITMKGKHGTQNHILIHGADPSIKLSDSPTMDSFFDMTLSDIVKEAIGYSGNGVEITINPGYTKPIDFVYQYNETCQQFINRLCHQYGENYYYNGTELIFGKTIIGDTIPIKYDVEMTDYVLEANLVPSRFKHYSYLVQDDEKYTKEAPAVPESTGYLQVANDKSDKIYTTDAITPLDASVNDSDAILDIVKAKRKKAVANMLRLSGKTKTCKIGIGNVIAIEFPKDMQIEVTEGEFIICDVIHIVDQQGHYQNEFSGVRQALNQVPMPPISIPQANPQQAKVVSNTDPKNQGRIQVEFQWQEARGKTTNFIRVQTPDSGGSDKVSSNRGLVTIPETGDTVMVGFEFGNPDKPFSMGSLFTSKNGGGGGPGNKTKSLTSRSGNALTLDDDSGSVLLNDQPGSGSFIEMNGAKEMVHSADKKIKIQSGLASIELDGTSNTITLSAETIVIDAGLFLQARSGEAVVIGAGTTLDASAKDNATFGSNAEAIVQGNAKTLVTAAGAVVLDGAVIKLN